MAKGRVLNTTISLMVAFLCGGVIGWVYEVFLCGPFNGDGIDLGHGGIGIPFLAIYAVGALAIEVVFGCNRKQFNPFLQILACALLCTALEYAAGLLMLHGLGVQTWDYRTPGWDFLATPDGLICFRASLTFGLMGLLQLRAVRALRVRLIAANAKGDPDRLCDTYRNRHIRDIEWHGVPLDRCGRNLALGTRKGARS